MATAGPQLTAKLGLDTSDFENGLKKALTAAEKAERRMERARYRVIYKKAADEERAAKNAARIQEQAARAQERAAKNAARIQEQAARAQERAAKNAARIQEQADKRHEARMKAVRKFVAGGLVSGFGTGGISGMGASLLMGGPTALGGVIGGAASGFTRGIENAYQYGREMMNLSRSTGIAAKNISVFGLAIKDSQIAQSEIVMSTKMMNQKLLEAAEGGGAARHVFAQLGLSYRALIHLPIEESFERVGSAIARTENPSLRAAAAVGVFGRTGARMLKLFERGGAFQLAREALGGSAGIIGKDGMAFEQVALRLSHIGVKFRSIFIGVADTILPMVDKFVKKFHAMDFTDFGKKLGNAINEAMTWFVTLWENPGDTLDYFWEYAKWKAREWGNLLLDKIDELAPGLGGQIVDFNMKTKAWGEILVGYAVDFGQNLLAGVEVFGAKLKQMWEDSGIPAVVEWLKSQAKNLGDKSTTTGQAANAARMVLNPVGALREWFFGGSETLTGPSSRSLVERLPGEQETTWRMRKAFLETDDGMQEQVNKWGGKQPESFDDALKRIQGKTSGKSLIAKGEADLAAARFASDSGATSHAGLDRLGAIPQHEKVKKMREKLQPWWRAAFDALNKVEKEGEHGQNSRRFSWKPFGFGSSLGGGSMTENGWHTFGDYGPNDVLGHREQVSFRNKAIAARAGRILASGHRDNAPIDPFEDFADRRRPGETANGDRQRAKAFAQEIARREASQGTDNQLLGDIARNTNVVAKAFQ
jgi:hypothetical protein